MFFAGSALMVLGGLVTAIVAIAGAAHIHIPSFVNMMKARKDVKVIQLPSFDHLVP